MLLKNTTAEIQALMLDLDKLAQSFHTRGLANKRVSNAVRWQWNRNRVTNLCAKAGRSRANLHLVMAMLTLFGQR